MSVFEFFKVGGSILLFSVLAVLNTVWCIFSRFKLNNNLVVKYITYVSSAFNLLALLSVVCVLTTGSVQNILLFLTCVPVLAVLVISVIFTILLIKNGEQLRFPALSVVFIFFMIIYSVLCAFNVPFVSAISLNAVNSLFILIAVYCFVFANPVLLNSSHSLLLKSSEVPLQICDNSFNTEYSCDDCNATCSDVKNAVDSSEPYKLNNETVLYVSKISGGYAVLHEDVSRLNILNAKLNEATAKLNENQSLIARESQISEENARLKQCNLLRSRTKKLVAQEIAQISCLLSSSPDYGYDEKTASDIQKKAKLLACLVKTKYKILDCAKNSFNISSQLISDCICEIANCLDDIGTKSEISSKISSNVSSACACTILDWFGFVCENVITVGQKTLSVALCENDNSVIVNAKTDNIEFKNKFDVKSDLLKIISSDGGISSCEVCRDGLSVTLRLPIGGAN